jgi:GT2 family glycosyltransferase
MLDIDNSVSLVICTKNRPEDLARLLASVLKQEPLPSEVIIVDDGSLPEVPRAAEFQNLGVQISHHRKSRPGICCSRNVGARLARCPLVMYLDDDTVLAPGYIREMSDIFRRRPEVMGARGLSDTTDGPATRRGQQAWQMLERFFLLRGRGHRVLPSGFGNPAWEEFAQATEVQFLTGCTTYRKSVFDTIQYDEALEELGPYAFGEDLAFSYRVGRERGRLIYLPAARLAHLRNTRPRLAPAHLSRLRLHNQYYIYRSCFRPEPGRPLAFAWALLGKTVLAGLGVLLEPGAESWRVFTGTLGGATLVGRMALGLSPVPRPAYQVVARAAPGE